MSRKITNVVLFLVVLVAAIGMTLYIGQGATGATVYNFIFLGIMSVIYLIGMILGMLKMNRLTNSFAQATEDITGIFKKTGKKDLKHLEHLKEIFDHPYLDKKMADFTNSIQDTEEGIGDIEEYINEEEIDLYIHKRVLDTIPDILTSLGILGTFVGLVWGLKNFNPSGFEAMTVSVSSLIEGIKVAFFTSIYGIAFSIVYTYGTRSEYSALSEKIQLFLEKFHAYVIPTAENESRNILIATQKTQTEAMKQMAQQFSEELVQSFEKVITPTFQKMNSSLDVMVDSVTKCQQDAIKEILNMFMKEMHGSFQLQFHDFSDALEQMKDAQKANVQYTSDLFQSMSRQLSDNYVKQEKVMTDLITQMADSQNKFMNSSNRVIQDNQTIQKMQQQDYQNFISYLKEAEQTAAKFWVACNQTMKKYVEAAAESVDAVKNVDSAQAELIKVNQATVTEFQAKLQEFNKYQQLSYSIMEQMQRLLKDISVKDNSNVYLSAGSYANNNSMDKLQKALEEQAGVQEELLREISQNLKELSRASQKGKTGIFRK